MCYSGVDNKMLKLVKLELKKTKLGWYFKGAVIANLCIFGFMCLIGLEERSLSTAKMAYADTGSTVFILGLFVRSVYIVFAAVLIAKLVIGEYRNKTITVMFTYPISRKKLMTAKLLIVSGLTFVTIIVSELVLSAIIFKVNDYFHFSSGKLAFHALGGEIGAMLVYAAAAAGLCLVPLYFGMRKHSVSATIVSSVILMILISQNSSELSLANNIYIPLALAAVGIIIAYRTIRKTDQEDVM